MTDDIIETLPVPLRLALSYAPAGTRPLFLGLFALDTRLAGIIRQGKEPMLAQMRLAWWRDVLAKEVDLRPSGEPLLEILKIWGGEEAALRHLAEGWEVLLTESPLPRSQMAIFCDARAEAFGSIARLSGVEGAADAACRAGKLWAIADLAHGLSAAGEKATALALASDAGGLVRLPRMLRPLTVLAGLARRSIEMGGGPLLDGVSDGLAAIRLGILGR
jgi:phytoene synthase